jgi:hypothetical protein
MVHEENSPTTHDHRWFMLENAGPLKTIDGSCRKKLTIDGLSIKMSNQSWPLMVQPKKRLNKHGHRCFVHKSTRPSMVHHFNP